MNLKYLATKELNKPSQSTRHVLAFTALHTRKLLPWASVGDILTSLWNLCRWTAEQLLLVATEKDATPRQ